MKTNIQTKEVNAERENGKLLLYLLALLFAGGFVAGAWVLYDLFINTIKSLT